MTVVQFLSDIYLNHLLSVGLAAGSCVGAGFVIGLCVFFLAEPYSLVADARIRTAWIAAIVGSIIGCAVVILFGLELHFLTFAAFLLLGSLTATVSGLLPLTLGLLLLRRVAGIEKSDFSKSHEGNERLKD
ncbi:MAG: hypothetical protein NTV93_00540 [Verrucomicrobia bacterium]|nr:hypothetical protein [Verrucomicrobiota bacterium]